MPNRIIRDGIIESERINALTQAAEIFFVRLMLKADDFGRYHGNSAILRAHLYPLKLDRVRESHVEKWLEECVQADLVLKYKCGSKRFILIPRFHQRSRAKTSKFPDPPAGMLTDDGHVTVTWQTRAHGDGDGDGDGDVVGGEGVVCPAPPDGDARPPPAPEIAIEIPLVGTGGEYGVTVDQVAEWAADFPGIDVLTELRACHAWNTASPTRRKTRAGVCRHIVAWLSRAQNSAKGGGTNAKRTRKYE